jgi:hypothetical protein
MMKSSELRIENLVYWDIPQKVNVAHRVMGIVNGRLQTIPISLGNKIEDYLPIPLTEEWLLKFGFTKVSTNYECGFLLLWGNLKTGTVDFVLTEPHSNKRHITALRYVHQLQNLYFALTGEELKEGLAIDKNKKD